jgi:hypothetical protein
VKPATVGMKLTALIASGTDFNHDCLPLQLPRSNRSYLVKLTLKKMKGLSKNGKSIDTGIFELTSDKTRTNKTKN